MDFIMHQLMLYIDGHPEESTYKALASQMLDSIEQLHSMTIYEMADRFFVSTATLSRFCRMLGYKNFSAFKNQLEVPYGFQIDYTSDYLNQPYETSFAYFKREALECLNQLCQTITPAMLCELVRKIHDHTNVYIAGYMGYELLFMYMQQKLGLFKKFIHVQPASLAPRSRKTDYGPADFVIVVSLRGSWNPQKEILPILQKNNVPRILISQNPNAYGKELYDHFYMIGGSFDNNMGMIALQFLIDQLIVTYYHLYQSELIV